jgi:hypothetical protein
VRVCGDGSVIDVDSSWKDSESWLRKLVSRATQAAGKNGNGQGDSSGESECDGTSKTQLQVLLTLLIRSRWMSLH